MAVCACERFSPSDGADGSNDAELCDRNIEFGVGSTGNHDDRPTARDAGDDSDRRAVDLAYGRAIDSSGDVRDGADNEIETVLARNCRIPPTDWANRPVSAIP